MQRSKQDKMTDLVAESARLLSEIALGGSLTADHVRRASDMVQKAAQIGVDVRNPFVLAA